MKKFYSFHTFESVAVLDIDPLNKRAPDTGDVLYQPTHQLREVVEVVTPEIPGKPVEPYVGLTWESPKGYKYVVCDLSEYPEGSTVAFYSPRFDTWSMGGQAGGVHLWAEGYPKTPSTPAVTRTVRKWVRLTDSEVESPELDPDPSEQQPSDGWIPWNGGDCPVPANKVAYRLRDGYGSRSFDVASNLRWEHSEPGSSLWGNDIIAYKVVD